MTSSPSLRLICDEMLAGLARWLRAAGYDTALLPPGAADQLVLAAAEQESRLLLTRDAALAARAPDALRLASDRLDEQAAELAGRLALDWSAAPFTRCLRDNSLLRPASSEEVATLPASSRDLPGPFRACPACRRVYWPGSHVRRMEARLERWRA